MTTVSEIESWLSRQDKGALVCIKDCGLALHIHGTKDYFEIGGCPDDDPLDP